MYLISLSAEKVGLHGLLSPNLAFLLRDSVIAHSCGQCSVCCVAFKYGCLVIRMFN